MFVSSHNALPASSMKHCAFIALFLISVCSFGQRAKDTLYLMNGRVVPAAVIDTLFGYATFQDPEDSTKRAHIENDQLFAIRYHTGDVFYYYEQDTISNWFTRDEMWLFMQGERDARKGFKPRGSLYGTMFFGMLGGLTGSFIGPIAPAVYLSMVGLPKVRIRHQTVSNINLLDHDAYILGYEREARSKRRIYSLIGAGIGLAVGYIGYATLNQYYPARITFTHGKFVIVQ